MLGSWPKMGKENSTEGRDVKPASSQPAYVVKPRFYWLKISSQMANKNLFKPISQFQPVNNDKWLNN